MGTLYKNKISQVRVENIDTGGIQEHRDLEQLARLGSERLWVVLNLRWAARGWHQRWRVWARVVCGLRDAPKKGHTTPCPWMEFDRSGLFAKLYWHWKTPVITWRHNGFKYYLAHWCSISIHKDDLSPLEWNETIVCDIRCPRQLCSRLAGAHIHRPSSCLGVLQK